jgi:hypothetical protein
MLDEIKFENTVLAILKAKPLMGSIQLRKALIIADALNYQLYGEGLTGADYVKHRYGLVPNDEAFLILQNMSFPKNMVDIIEMPSGPYTKVSYRAAQEPDYSLFMREQINIINFAAHTACKYTAAHLSDMTHDENYMNIPMGAEIKLDTVCVPGVSGYETPPMPRAEKKAVKEFLKSDEARLFSFV